MRVRRPISLAALAALMLAGCATKPPPEKPKPTVEMIPAPPEPAWKGIATEADQAKLAALPGLLLRAKASVPKWMTPKVKAEAELLDPAAAQPLPQLPPGPYHCRLVRLGGSAHIATFPPDFCYVGAADNDRLAFTKQTGSSLPEGYIFADGDKRQIFLGTVQATGQKDAPGYGHAPDNDLAGTVERVSAFRWRLMLTRAKRGALLDLYELVPVPPAVPGAPLAVPGR